MSLGYLDEDIMLPSDGDFKPFSSFPNDSSTIASIIDVNFEHRVIYISLFKLKIFY